MTQIQERSAEPTFSWTAEPDGAALRIAFKGDLDIATVQECRRSLEEPLAGPEQMIALDLNELEFADSTGLHFLITTQRELQAAGKKLVLDGVSAPVLRLFDVTGMTTWFDYANGSAPKVAQCPLCDHLMLAGATRCPHCGGAI
jgi:anti-anti-sigma factor